MKGWGKIAGVWSFKYYEKKPGLFHKFGFPFRGEGIDVVISRLWYKLKKAGENQG